VGFITIAIGAGLCSDSATPWPPHRRHCEYKDDQGSKHDRVAGPDSQLLSPALETLAGAASLRSVRVFLQAKRTDNPGHAPAQGQQQ